ncbi:hypothetical protein ABIB57_001111 [Devosia sp. UYZn731]|uniref:hypothetical protein n=1 Tax=Devosia sp. UYZn731 TaxID=3156345 RepID=UPI003395740E
MIHKLLVRLSVCFLLLWEAACGRSESSGTTAPFTATYANLSIHVPARADLFQATNHDFGLMVRVCKRDPPEVSPPLCEDLSSPLVSENGILTYVKEPKAGTKFNLITERAAEAISPASIPLLPIAGDEIDTDILAGGEAYYLSRLNMGGGDHWYTTAEGWPVAGCNRDQRGQHFCSVGFLRAGAFIEAHWFPESGVELTQLDIWLVATAIDNKVLELAE